MTILPTDDGYAVVICCELAASNEQLSDLLVISKIQTARARADDALPEGSALAIAGEGLPCTVS